MAASEPLDGGSTGGDTTDGSTSDGSTGGDGGAVILPGIQSVSDVLVAFGRNPLGFILGVTLSALLGGVTTIVASVQDSILFIFQGDARGVSGRLGLADIPVLGLTLVTDAFGLFGGAVLSVADTLTTTGIQLAESFGVFSPIAYAALVAVTLVATAYVTRTIAQVALDLIPGGGGLL